MPGDSLYSQWPEDLRKEYILKEVNELVVPHHGSEMKAGDADVIKLFMSKSKNAYISFGHNGWGHPNEKHIDELVQAGFDVQATGGEVPNSYCSKVCIENEMIKIIL